MTKILESKALSMTKNIREEGAIYVKNIRE